MKHPHLCHPVRQPHLKRVMGLAQASMCGVGIIVGAGIYALIGVGARHAGPALWLGFLIAAIIASLTGLSYAELSSMFKDDAAEYDYIKAAFNRKLALAVSLIVVFASVLMTAAASLGFGGYLSTFTGWPPFVGAGLIIIVLSIVNAIGIRKTAIINNIFTVVGLVGLAVIIALGLARLGHADLLSMPNGIRGVLQSSALMFFAYIGFESIVRLSEETKNPTKTIPRAIIISVAVSTAIYMLVSVAAVNLLDWTKLGASSAPLADAVRPVFGESTSLLMSVFAMICIISTVLMSLVATSRLIYGLGEMRAIPSLFSRVSAKTKTPLLSIALIFILAMLSLAVRDIERLASVANVFIFITFALVNISVVVLRRTCSLKRNFCIPGTIRSIPILPILGAVMSTGMVYYALIGIV